MTNDLGHELDTITIELIRHRLVAGAQQMAVSLWKSSYSTVIREVLDYSAAIFDAAGQMVAQSAQLPFQMMTMSRPLQQLLESGITWDEGDIVLLNDPYACDAQHLPDFMTFRPVFWKGEVVAFCGAVAHMIDTGGGAPGSYVASATEIYQEGLRIPPVKLHRRGEENTELLDLILLNVREPVKVRGDMAAMCASTVVGSRAVLELLERHGPRFLEQALETILSDSERHVRARLRDIGRTTSHAVDYVDDDGISDEPIRLELSLRFEDGSVVADFSGTAGQVRGPVNATYEMTNTTVNYVLMAVLGEGIPKNDGCRRPIKVVAPRGSVVNSESPAPVVSRVTTCHRVVDLVMQALAGVIPERVTAGYYGSSNICNLGGYDAQTGDPWVHFEIEVGGWGARPNSDGLDGFSAHIHNLANTPIEIVESTQPLRIERYELLPDTAGVGEYRGGLGLRRDIRVLVDHASLNLLGDHSKFGPKGLRGGSDGVGGRYILNPESSTPIVMPNKVANYPMRKNDVISMQTPGGAGYGRVEDRDPAAIDVDRREGKVTQL